VTLVDRADTRLGLSTMTEPMDTIIVTGLDSPEAAPLVEALGVEYATRYEDYDGFEKLEGEPEEIDLFPPLVFEEPLGTLLVVRRDGQTVAGGAFMYLDDETAEIKRVWTSPNHRRQGLSRTVMTALEDAAAARGYRRIYLTTGPRQPEAVGLYLALGYTALFDLDADPETIAHLAFEKEVGEEHRDDGRGVLLPTPADREKAAAQRAAVAEAHRWHERPALRLKDLIPRD
jgi:GNAT superfamily N-acetyltransferase